jgi:hypothetical protein
MKTPATVKIPPCSIPMQPRNELPAVNLSGDSQYMATTTSAAKKSSKNPAFYLAGPGGLWTDEAPRSIRQSYRTAPNDRRWAAWRKYLGKRKNTSAAELLSERGSSLVWAAVSESDAGSARRLIALLTGAIAGRKRDVAAVEEAASAWLAAAETAPRSAAFAIDCLAWSAALPGLVDRLSETLWWTLLKRVTAIAGMPASPADDPLAAQLLSGELALTLASVFPELGDCRAQALTGRVTLDMGFAELLDGEGLPHRQVLPVLGPLLACWTRCRTLGPAMACGCWSDAAEAQFAGLVQYALRLCRTEGTAVFAAPSTPRWKRALIKSAVRLANDRQTSRIDRLLNGKQNRAAKADHPDLPTASFQGEWAGIAVLRSDWRPSVTQMTVAFNTAELNTELTSAGKRLWSGAWDLEVRWNNQACEPLDDWEQVCWEVNDDVAYLELEMQLSGDVTVQRHILLARQEQFLFLADAVLGIQHGSIAYRSTLPLAGLSTFQGEAESREGSLSIGERPRCRVLPLALPEWRNGFASGRFQASEAGVELAQSAEGECLFAPLFVDLSRKRIDKQLTWRQLTVGQLREIVPGDVAVGYRVQVGKSQWLVYRSLAPAAIRTILGQNVMHEFLVGRFHADGHVETLLEIE